MAHELHRLLAKNLKAFRAHRGLTQDGLAEKAGVSKNYLAEIETGRKYPSPDTFVDLAKALEVRPYRLIMDEPLDLLAFGKKGSKDDPAGTLLARELIDVLIHYVRPDGVQRDR